MTPEFTPSRSQDAWFVFRGFAYQIDTTLLRWAHLTDDGILLLERGEDIDHVANRVLAGDFLLEQIKQLEDNVTLRNTHALTAIANHLHHRATNPGVPFVFRFTTTANIGVEKPSITDDRTTGVALWQKGGKTGGRTERSTLKKFFQKSKKPADVNKDAWKTFEDFWKTATDKDIREVLQSFEWSCGSPDSSTLEDEVQVQLFSNKQVPSLAEAKRLYPMLFMKIMRMLAQPGEKRLDRQLLTDFLENPTWTSQDQQLYEAFQSRLQKLEHMARQHSMLLRRVEAQLGLLARESNVDINAVYVAYTPIPLDPPLPFQNRTLRTQTVDAAVRALQHHTLLALNGPVGVGKSQVAVMVAEQVGQPIHWLSFENDPQLAAAQLDTGLASLTGGLLASPTYQEVAQQLQNSTVVVLDNLPALNSNALTARLEGLVTAFSSKGVKVISTSHHPLPPAFTQRVQQAVNFQIPSFNQQEVQEVLVAHGMPDQLPYAKAVLGITGGHATLVAAAARFLASGDWQFTDKDLQAFMQNAYAGDIQNDTLRRLTSTVTDEKTLELLYRLMLGPRRFLDRHVQVVSAVVPEIGHPRGKFASLQGEWIEAHPDRTHSIVPLARNAGHDLDRPTTVRVHQAFAQDIIKQKLLGPGEVMQLITHHLAADEPNKALRMWVWTILQAKAQGVPATQNPVLRIWANTPLPSHTEPGLKLAVRMLQYQLLPDEDQNPAFLRQEIHALTASEGMDINGALVLGFVQDPEKLARQDFSLACKMVRLLMESPSLQFIGIELTHLLNQEVLTFLLLVLAVAIRSLEQALDWIELAEIAQQGGLYSIETPLEWDALQMVAEKLLYLEFSKPQQDQNWNTALQKMLSLTERARASSLPTLWAWSVSAQVRMLEQLNLLQSGLDLVTYALEQTPHPSDILILCEAAARQLFAQNRFEEALPWLIRAVEQPVAENLELKLQVALMLSTCEGKILTSAGYRNARAAALFAQDNPGILTHWQIRAQGSAAVAAWAAGQLDQAYQHIGNAMEQLLGWEEEVSEHWRELQVKLMHFVAHCIPDLRKHTHVVKQSIEAGSQLVHRHLFASVEPAWARQYQPELKDLCYSQLADFADLVGMDFEAAMWARRGMNGPLTLAGLGSLATHAMMDATLRKEYGEALDHAIRGAKALAGFRHAPEDTRMMVTEADLPELLGQKPSVLWRNVEEVALESGVLPIAFCIARELVVQRELGHLAAQDFASICRQFSTDAVEPSWWMEVGEAIDLMGAISMQPQQFGLRGNQAAMEGKWVMATLWQLASTLRSDCPVQMAAKIHLEHLDYLKSRLADAKKGAYRLTFSFFMAYWQQQAQLFARQSSVFEKLRRDLRLWKRNPEQAELSLKFALNALVNPTGT